MPKNNNFYCTFWIDAEKNTPSNPENLEILFVYSGPFLFHVSGGSFLHSKKNHENSWRILRYGFVFSFKVTVLPAFCQFSTAFLYHWKRYLSIYLGPKCQRDLAREPIHNYTQEWIAHRKKLNLLVATGTVRCGVHATESFGDPSHPQSLVVEPLLNGWGRKSCSTLWSHFQGGESPPQCCFFFLRLGGMDPTTTYHHHECRVHPTPTRLLIQAEWWDVLSGSSLKFGEPAHVSDSEVQWEKGSTVQYSTAKGTHDNSQSRRGSFTVKCRRFHFFLQCTVSIQ